MAGILGALMLYSIYVYTFAVHDMNPWFKYVFLVGVPLVFALMFFWIAYLVWFRFSSRAIQQVCGLLGFLLVSFVMTEFPPTGKADTSWQPLAYFIILIAFVLCSYRVLSHYLNSIIFGHESTTVEEQSTK